MHWMEWFGGGWFMMIFWWIIIIGLIYLAVKFVAGQKSGPTLSESALEILKKRYARGEISKQEFEKKKKDLV